VLVLQGGGALGTYQVGVYQALHEAGIKLDWVIGTSIGAINAGLIAGNIPERRLDALQEFWRRMRSEGIWHYLPAWTGLPDVTSYLTTLFGGISSFFRPNAAAFLGPHLRLGAERAGFYSTAPLRKTVSELVDFSLINRSSLRVTVGASEVRSYRPTRCDFHCPRARGRARIGRDAPRFKIEARVKCQNNIFIADTRSRPTPSVTAARSGE
jgi:NTE family protein